MRGDLGRPLDIDLADVSLGARDNIEADESTPHRILARDRRFDQHHGLGIPLVPQSAFDLFSRRREFHFAVRLPLPER